MGGVIAALMVTVGANISGFTSGMSQVNKGITSAGKTATIAGAALTAGVTVPLTILGKEAASTATAFDKEMRNIQSISKQSDSSLLALGSTFKTLSADITQTTDSATNLAAGFYQVQSSGFAGDAALTVLKASTKAASAGLTDTEAAAKGVLAVLNAYGMGADQATRVSDVMFRTVDVGVLSFEELSGQIGDVVSTAATAGVPIEQVGAAIATLTKGGLSAAESVTALNQMMLAFIDPATESAKMAAALGIDFSAAALKSKGLGGVMEEVRLKTGGNIETMSKLFGNVRALKSALSLTRSEGKAFAGDLTTLAGAAGATSQAFAIQTQSYDAQSKNFANTVNVLKIAIGEQLLPILTSLGQAVLPVVRAFTSLPDPVKKIIVVLGIVAAVIGPLLTMFGMAAMGIGALGTVFGAVAGAIGAAVGLISAPLLLVIGAVAAFALAWKNNWLGIRDVVASVVGWIKGVLSGLGGVLKSVFGKLFGISPAEIDASLSQLGGALASGVEGIKGTLGGLFKGAGKEAGAGLGVGIAEGAKGAVAGATSGLSTDIAKGMKDVMVMAEDGSLVPASFYDVPPDDTLLASLSGVSTAATDTSVAAGLTATSLQNMASGSTTAAASTLQAQTALTSLATTTTTAAATMTAAQTALGEQSTALYTGMSTGAAQTQAAVVSAFEQMSASAQATVAGMVAGVLGVMQGATGGAASAGAAIGSAFAAGISSQAGAVAAAAAALAAAANEYLPHSDAARGPLSDVSSSGPALADSFASGILSGVRSVRLAAQGLANAAAMSGVGAQPGLGPSAAAPQARGEAGSNTTTVKQPITITIYNPTGRTAESDVFRQLKYLAALGIIQPVPTGTGS